VAAQRAVAIDEKVRGPEHLSTAKGLDALALALLGRDRAADAEAPARNALRIREKALPAVHPDLAVSNERLAAVLRKLGKKTEAEPFDAEAKATRDKHAISNRASGS
jgi:hypothetical protein